MHNAAPFYQGHIPCTRWKTNCVYNITTIATDTTRSTICYSSSSINLASSLELPGSLPNLCLLSANGSN